MSHGGAVPKNVIEVPGHILGRIINWLIAHSPWGHSSPQHDLVKRLQDAVDHKIL
jgi:hypothetical protein